MLVEVDLSLRSGRGKGGPPLPVTQALEEALQGLEVLLVGHKIQICELLLSFAEPGKPPSKVLVPESAQPYAGSPHDAQCKPMLFSLLHNPTCLIKEHLGRDYTSPLLWHAYLPGLLLHTLQPYHLSATYSYHRVPQLTGDRAVPGPGWIRQ